MGGDIQTTEVRKAAANRLQAKGNFDAFIWNAKHLPFKTSNHLDLFFYLH